MVVTVAFAVSEQIDTKCKDCLGKEFMLLMMRKEARERELQKSQVERCQGRRLVEVMGNKITTLCAFALRAVTECFLCYNI